MRGLETIRRLAVKTAFFAVGAGLGALLYGPLAGSVAGSKEAAPPPAEFVPTQPTELADLSLGPRAREVARRRTETAAFRPLQRTLRLPATLTLDETREKRITARVAGRIDDLFADTTGIAVERGQPLALLYSPPLETAQKELLLARRSASSPEGKTLPWAKSALEAARRKLRLYGVSPEQMAEIERKGEARTSLEILSPIRGTILELPVREGAYVQEGKIIARIADLTHLWGIVWVHEDDLAWVHAGQAVHFQSESGETFHGRVAFIDPFVSPTRAVRVRINVPNPRGNLKPGLFARATLVVHVGAEGRVHIPGLENRYICRNHTGESRPSPGTCPHDGLPLVRVGGRIGPFKTRALPREGMESHEEHDPAPSGVGVLAVGRDAVIVLGMRRLVSRRNRDGAFELVDVRVGVLADGYYPVLAGLQENDTVASEGNLSLDSEEQIPFPPEEAPPFFIAQRHCPVMGGEIDKSQFMDFRGMRIYFCCAGCEKSFLEDPDKYLASLEALGEKPVAIPGE
ncbi:MAG: efflux RND transporter periplasmic adaptor subunit [Planctomycetota bacterium]|jgi:Cu(I)/Ag(I) efflux system membrane fusion protein